MKKFRFSALCPLVLAAILLSGCAQVSPVSADHKKVTLAQAREVALSHAGLAAADVRWRGSDLDFDNGRYIYELEFKSGKLEYSYDIDAATGQILKSEKEFDD